MKRYKNKLYVLLGEAASGKDFLFKEILLGGVTKQMGPYWLHYFITTNR